MVFFKKKNLADDPEFKAQKLEAEKAVATVEDVQVESKDVKDSKNVEVDLEQVVAENTELWYKAQVLGLLLDINERLKRFEDGSG
jgi:hypothetical protein